MKKLLCLAIIVGIVVGCNRQVLTYQGHNIDQWLQILRADTNSIENPLTISKIIYDGQLGNPAVEVPMSYDLLKQNDFLQIHGKFDLSVNDRVLSVYTSQATNGNCLLNFDKDSLHFGTNQIQA